MFTNPSTLRRRAPQPVVMSSSDSDHDEIQYLPPSDPPSDASMGNIMDTSEDIPLRDILKREVERDSSPDLEFVTPMQRLFRMRPRSSSLPPVETMPMISSDDIIFTPRTERRVRVAAGQAKRIETMARNKVLAEEERVLREAQEARDKRLEQETFFRVLVADIREHGSTLSDFLEYLATTKTTRTTVLQWATGEVKATVASESAIITKLKIVRKSGKVIDEAFFLDYSLSDLTTELRGLAPTMFTICDAFSMTPRQERTISNTWLKKKELVSYIQIQLSVCSNTL